MTTQQDHILSFPPELEADLRESITEADRGDVIAADDVFAEVAETVSPVGASCWRCVLRQTQMPS